LESTVSKLDEKIGEYVKNDTTAFFNYEQYTASLPELVEVAGLRAKSVTGQLDGSIPSTTGGQSENEPALIDASAIDLSTLGSMGGGNRGGENGERGGFGEPGSDMPDRETMQQAMQILRGAENGLTDEIKMALTELGLSDEQIEQFATMQNGGFAGRGMGGEETAQPVAGAKDYILFGALLALLAATIIFIARPRKNVI
jgi:hypothetical protein